VPAVHQGYLEPHTCLVGVEPNGKIDVWSNNKSPFAARTQLARAIGVPEEQLRLHVMPIGGDFGGKGSLMDAVVCYHLAARARRPVKMVMTYAEELMAANPRHDLAVTIRTGVTADGRITARFTRLLFNSGAYGAFRRSITLPNNRAAVSSYRIPHMELEALCVYTNTVPRGYMRAPGGPQVVFAAECHTDMIAHALGIDPLDFRRRNLLEEGDESPIGLRWEDIRVKEVLEAAAQAVGWDTPKGPDVGRGIAVFNKEPRPWPAEATLRMEQDAGTTLITAVPDNGAGAYTVFQQIVAEELGVPLTSVAVVAGDTDTAPYDAGIGASRVTHTAGQAVQAATRLVKVQLLQRASMLMELPAEDLHIQDGHIVAPDGQEMSLAELVAGSQELIQATARDNGDEGPGATSFCVQAAEVAVDRETGQVQVRKLVSAHDVGTVLNPLTHQGQVEGGVIQGFGQAVMEHLEMDEGMVETLNLGDYKLPSIADLPPLETVLVSAAAGELPFGGKHIGELSNVPLPAAIANAVFDAVGVRLMDLPVTAEKVYDQLHPPTGASP
jgi:CO/xanthine dehydrogenase Mo-binding subunit